MTRRAVYSLKDLEKVLGLGVRTLREYVKGGRLQATKIGRSYYVTESSFKTFIGEKE